MSKLLTFEIDAAVAVECGDLCGVESDSDHPNKASFTGTLLVVDEPSTRPPNGADGHRILVPKDVARKKLSTLIGMGINYQPNKLQGHMPRHKVGVISKAWLEGNQVKCSGIIWDKDFPEAAKELKGSNIGMSMELANVLVADKNANVWKLKDFSFTGATALYKNSAAYQKTSLSAAAERELQILLGGVMSDKHKKKKVAAISGSSKQLGNLVTAIGAAVQNGLKEGLKPFGKKLTEISASVEEQGKAFTSFVTNQETRRIEASTEDESGGSSSGASVHASAEESNTSNTSEASDELEAAGDSSMASGSGKMTRVKAKKGKADDDAVSSSSSSSYGSSSDVDAELEKLSAPAKGTKAGPDEESSDPEFGELNKNAKNKGNKTSVNASVVKHVREIAAAADKRIKTLKASADKLRKNLRKETKSRKALEASVEEMQAQIDNFTENNVGPKSLPPAVGMLLNKSGIDINELQASGRKLTVAEVDDMIAAGGVTLSPVEKMTMKNNLLEKGLMEVGEITRQ